MAQRVQIILEDDYDGGEADETVSFALDGAEYELDLSSENAAKLRDELAVWIGHARKTGGRRRRDTRIGGRRRRVHRQVGDDLGAASCSRARESGTSGLGARL